MIDLERWRDALELPSGSEAALEQARALARDQPEQAASAYDQAFMLDPEDTDIAGERAALLDSLTVVHRGLELRYVPAGPFLMGSESGDPDEAPQHVAHTGAFWISATPVSWAAYCDLLGWSPPPEAFPPDVDDGDIGFSIHMDNRVCMQYCEDETLEAGDWHSHAPLHYWTDGAGKKISSEELFGKPPRCDVDQPLMYHQKPMVAVSWSGADHFCRAISTGAARFRLPTEAQWEKAARGGLVGARYAWGDEAGEERADWDRFSEFSILPSRTYTPNGYGLYAVCGGVCEWTSEWYDAEAYNRNRLAGASEGKQRVLRGGSWSDCAEACTVSFRLTLPRRWSDDRYGLSCPNVGFRICMTTNVTSQ